jgi:hypothetical protein
MLRIYIKKNRNFKDIPNKYTLGKGHIRFFSNKAIFLSRRLSELVEEQKRRGFKHNSIFDLNELPQESLNDWNPTEEAIKINLNRIFEKISKRPSQWKYESQSIKLNDYYKIVSQKYEGKYINLCLLLEKDTIKTERFK